MVNSIIIMVVLYLERIEMPAMYAQLYIYDPKMALQQRMTRNNTLSPTIMSDLQEILLEHSPFVRIYQQAAERLRAHGASSQTTDIQAQLAYLPHSDPRWYNIPTTNEIAVILPGDGITTDPCDVIVQLKGGGFRRVLDTQPAYVPLHYILLFPKGELGWHPEIPQRNQEGADSMLHPRSYPRF
jgi:hypothetical protein